MTSRAAESAIDLHIEAMLVRAMLAVARRDGRDDAIAPLRDRQAGVESRLARIEDDRTPLDEVAAALDLDPIQVDFLLAAIALAIEPRLAPHVEALGGAISRQGLTVALFAQLHDLDERGGRDLALALAGASPLVAHGLLLCANEALAPTVRPYVAPPRVVAHVIGAPYVDPRISIQASDEAHVFDDEQVRTLALLSTLLDAPRAVVVVEGPSGGGRVTAIARAAGEPVAVLDLEGFKGSELSDALLALRRECVLVDARPVLDGLDALDPDARRVLGRTLAQWHVAVTLTSAVPGIEVATSRPVARVPWPVPGVQTRARLWHALSGSPERAPLDALAMRYPVGPGTIQLAVESARLIEPDVAAPTAATLAAGLRHNIAEKLAGLAQRIEVTQSWDDLVLADDTRAQVDALVARVRYAHHVLERWGYRQKLARGAGVAALFSGLPGTGKTMVAGLIARELDLELYQVDLSQVVSKWVGETEKQLARIFDAAEQGHALLLFDEADALFGQRSVETRGAVDRYANLEVNFLLQRVEAFGGVTILTTNQDTAIDRALKRRLAAHIVFDLPDEDERVLLWRRLVTTAEAPLARDLDLERLAHDFPKMSGANIRNAALAAAFLAAADGAVEIRDEHLVRAARVEYRSMGHVLAENHAR